MTSMEERNRHLGAAARNPQRRPVLSITAGRRVPTQGNADGSGAGFSLRLLRSVQQDQRLPLSRLIFQTGPPEASEGVEEVEKRCKLGRRWRIVRYSPLLRRRGTCRIRISRADRGTRKTQLLEGCRAGNVSAFERLYEMHGARMKSVAANLLGDLSDAEDAVQDCFLKVYRGAASFRGASRLSTWIYRVLVNTCYDMLRKRGRRPSKRARRERRRTPAASP